MMNDQITITTFSAFDTSELLKLGCRISPPKISPNKYEYKISLERMKDKNKEKARKIILGL